MAIELLKLESKLAKQPDIFGSTPLHYAASIGNARMARMLLSHNASLAYCNDSFGLFPVHVAAYIGNPVTVVTLLENNFDSWELLDHRGRNFLHVGAESDTDFSIKFIIEKAYESNTWPKLREVLRKASYERDNEGNTPLHLAARGERRCTVESLTQKKWIDFAVTSLDNLALSFDQSRAQFSKSISDDISYEEIYQHYKNQDFVGKASKSHQRWLLFYIDERLPPESSEILASRVQTIALGSVLIATVTFAAAFTLPGGYGSSDGTPILARKYSFRAFILADAAAFVCSFLSTFYLILIGTTRSGRSLQKYLDLPQYAFTMATKSMVAFAFGLYVVLAPIGKVFSIVVLLTTLLAALHVRYHTRKPLTWGFYNVVPFIFVLLLAFIK